MSEKPTVGRSSTFGADVDALFDALAHQRRRYALFVLLEHAIPITLPDLADEVAVRERGVSLPEVSAETVKRIYLSLYHSHVPKLEDAGAVNYSQEQDMVALTDRETVERVLAPVCDGISGGTDA